MGILWRLLAPKPVKRARRTVRKVAHPVRTASWALSPKPVKQIRRAAFKVTHPVEATELAVSDQIVRAVRGTSRTRRQAPRGTRSRTTQPAATQRVDVTWLPGTHQITVAGLEHHRAAVTETVDATPADGQADALLLPEPANPHDPSAIAVYMVGGHVGYIPRRTAAALQPALIALSARYGRQASCPALVEARGQRIVLLLDLAELGIDPTAIETP